MKLLDRGLENASKLVTLRNMRNRYADLLNLSEQITSGPEIPVRQFRAVLDSVSKSDPGLYPDVARRLKASLDTRVRLERGRNPALAANFEAAGAQIFPDQTRPAATTAPMVAASRPAPTNPTNPTSAPVAPTSTPGVQPSGDSSSAVTPTAASMQTVAAPKPCRPEFAGAGRRSQAVCYDGVANGRGPDLVVLPAGGPFANAVGVTRFEITNEDYNFYCSSTGRCKTVSAAARLPIVSISAADAERYAAWLSDASGKVYRMPSDAEWTYLATGIPEGNDFNCTMEVGGQKVKGFALAERNSGTASKWGVYNVVGNAQEWAKGPGGWVARGGSFSDNVSNCGIALGRVHSGAPDGKTGFRLVREL